VRVALAAVEDEWRAAGEVDEFALLKPHLNGDAAHGALGALARAQGMNEGTLRSALLHPIVWRLAALYFSLIVGFYSISFWTPTFHAQ
jgi:hypothetical protein